MVEIQLSSNHRLATRWLSGLDKMLTLCASESSSVKWGHLPHKGVRRNGWLLSLLSLLAVNCGGAGDAKIRELGSREV